MIKIKNAKKIYKMGDQEVKALDDVTLSIETSDFLAIVGPSGSGKSTLLHTIGGLDSLDSGDINVGGENLKELKDKKKANFRNKTIGFIFQSFNLQNHMSALENVELPLIFSSVKKNERRKRAEKVLDEVGLSERLNHKPNELSGGQQQRVCIARALINKPKVILADEPTGNLDSKSGAKIIELLHDLNKDLNVTVIVVTHDDRIASKADRIIHILDGKIKDDVSNGKKKAVRKYTD